MRNTTKNRNNRMRGQKHRKQLALVEKRAKKAARGGKSAPARAA